VVLVATSALLYGSVEVPPREAPSTSRRAPEVAPDCDSAPRAARPRRLRRLADRLSALLADDGMSERFAAERRRDDDLLRRVERRRHR
jgi:hypothetical protein